MTAQLSKKVVVSEGPVTASQQPTLAGGVTRYEFSPDLVTLVGDRALEAEGIRTIRTHIIARHIKDGRRGLAVCAASKNVGCTFTAANLAVSLAQVGVATLLVDGNMREPQLETMFRPQTSVPGLMQVLELDGDKTGPHVHAEVIPNLSLLYSGGQATNAQELLAGEAFRSFIQRSLRDFEFTIVDTPAANTCADALRISSMVGYALIVARANFSRVSEVSSLASELHEDGARVVGTVLNEV